MQWKQYMSPIGIEIVTIIIQQATSIQQTTLKFRIIVSHVYSVLIEAGLLFWTQLNPTTKKKKL